MRPYIFVPKLATPIPQPSISAEAFRTWLVQSSEDFAPDLREVFASHHIPEYQAGKWSDEPQFVVLPYVGAAIAIVKGHKQAVQLAAAANYEAIPDIELPIATSVASGGPQSPPWSEVSGVPQAHSDGILGQGVLVGVMDTGCDADHQEFEGSPPKFRHIPSSLSEFRDQRGCDPSGHGTHVCGVIGGKNIGVAPQVDLWVAGVIGNDAPHASLSRVFAGINWLAMNFRSLPENVGRPAVINMSFGYVPGSLQSQVLQQVDLGLHRLVQRLLDLKILPVAAIGNEGLGVVRAPGCFPEALGVGSVDFDLRPHTSSGSGAFPTTGPQKPDIMGYGVDILSAYGRNHSGISVYEAATGTSMAAAYVTGIAALHASADPALTGLALRARILDTALPLARYPGPGLARFVP